MTATRPAHTVLNGVDTDRRMGRGGALGRALERNRSALLGMATAALAAAAVAPILMTPFRADDTVNQGIADGFHHTAPPLPVDIWNSVVSNTRIWATTQGRFFPGSVLWSQSVFALFPDREAYKAFLALVSLVMIAAVGWFMVTATRSRAAAVLATVAFASTMTLRFPWFDGLDSFAGLLPCTVALTFAATALLLQGRGWRSAVAATVLWTAALLTYEVVIVMLPGVVAASLVSRRGRWRSVSFVWPTLADLVLVLWLRAHATAVTPAYTTSFEFGPVIRTYIRQAAAALPLAQLWFPGAAGIEMSKRLVIVTLITVGLAVVIALLLLQRSRIDIAPRSLAVLALLGSSAWLFTPVLTAITVRWQNELPPGQGYISVVWGYAGVAVLAVVAWLAAATWRTRRPGALPTALLTFFTVAFAVIAAVNVAQSYSVVGSLLRAMSATSSLAG